MVCRSGSKPLETEHLIIRSPLVMKAIAAVPEHIFHTHFHSLPYFTLGRLCVCVCVCVRVLAPSEFQRFLEICILSLCRVPLRTFLCFIVRPMCLRAHGTNEEPSWKFDTGRLNCRFKGLRIPSSFLIMYSHSPRCLVRQRTLEFDSISNRWSRAQGPSLHKSKKN